MKFRSGFVVVVASALLFGACASAPPSLSPAGVAAFNQTRVIKALDIIRDTAIAANAQQPPVLSEVTTRKIVTYHRSALVTIRETPNGWKSIVATSLTEVGKDLPPKDAALLAPYFALAQTVIQEVVQ